jgi:hypothetical protein
MILAHEPFRILHSACGPSIEALISVVGFETHACQKETHGHCIQISRILFWRASVLKTMLT